MKRFAITVTIALASLAGAVAAMPASAAPARTGSVTAAAPAFSWTGATTNGANATWFVDSIAKTGKCDTAGPTTYCDDTLVRVDVCNTKSTSLTFRIEGFGKPTDDFDLRVYESDANGGVGKYLGSPVGDVAATSPLGDSDPRHTSAGDFETKVVADVAAQSYYLVRVVYFTVASSNYKGKITMSGLPVQVCPQA